MKIKPHTKVSSQKRPVSLLPNIYRFIAEAPLSIQASGILLCILLFLGGVLVAIDTGKVIRFVRMQQELSNKWNYWNEITQVYPGYRDGYVQLLLLDFQRKDKQRMKDDLTNIIRLDPNYDKRDVLESIGESK